jgi:hypothetical protein
MARRHIVARITVCSHPSSRPCQNLANAAGDDEAVGPLGRAVDCALAQTALGEAGPQLAGVRTAGQGQVSVDDGIAGRDHGWVARLPVESDQLFGTRLNLLDNPLLGHGRSSLQGHAVDDKLHGEVSPVGGHTLAVECRLGGRVEAVLVDQVPQDLVEDSGPDGADAVDLGLSVDACVGVRVGGHVCAEEVCPDAGGVVVDPRAHGVVCIPRVGLLQSDGGGHKVTPALAHATRLNTGQTPGVGATAGQTVGQTVGILVDDDAGLEAAVADRGALGPQVHAHPAGLAVGRRAEIGIVGGETVLGIDNGKVAALATLAVVAGLEVVRRLGEPKLVQQVVVCVHGVEQLCDRCVICGTLATLHSCPGLELPSRAWPKKRACSNCVREFFLDLQ